jgi:hypothetical protein
MFVSTQASVRALIVQVHIPGQRCRDCLVTNEFRFRRTRVPILTARWPWPMRMRAYSAERADRDRLVTASRSVKTCAES